MPTREERARAQLEKKLTFEAAFRRGLLRDYVRLNTHWSSHYGLHGFMPSLGRHELHFKDTIETHSKLIHRAFREDVIGPLPPTVEAVTERNLDQWAVERAGLTSSLVVAVAGKRIEQTIRRAREAIASPLKKSSTVARVAKNFLRRIFRRSADTVAATETQAAAEGTKQTVADALAGKATVPSGLPAIPDEELLIVEKIWMDRMDERVRPHHIDARGQRVRFDDPYIVMGERLMFPGDRSLGASAVNVINCRCSSLFERSD